MGFIKGKFEQSLDNRTKCNSWNDIYESHSETEENAVLKFEDILGILILLAIGLGISILMFVFEKVYYMIKKKKMM